MTIPKVQAVIALNEYQLLLNYANGEARLFDLRPWLDKGMFKALRVPELFKAVRPFHNTVEWANGADLDPETLYSESRPAEPIDSKLTLP